MTHLCVYIIECQGLYKIGKTNDLKWRIGQLQGANPLDIRVAHVIYTEKHSLVELALHSIFADNRVRGEWFQLSQNDLELIKSMSVDDILDRAVFTQNIASAVKTTHPQVWPLDWETIQLPEKFIVPVKILNQSIHGNKRLGTLFSSFVLIFNLAWASEYKCTPPVNETELIQYLKLSRRQYYDQKSAMEKLGWLSLTRLGVGEGMVQFEFDESLLTDAGDVAP